MKLQPLNLEGLARDVFDIFDDEEFDLTVSSIKSLIKQRLKSACEFWLKYKDNPLLLCEEKPEYKKEFEPFTTAFKSSAFSSQKLKWILDKYNDWLFRLCFKSVLEDDKK